MSARDWMNNHGAVVTLVAVVVLVLAAGVIFRKTMGNGAPPVREVYYYDLGTGKIFLSSDDQFPPIEAPSGPRNGVQAILFSCGACDKDYDGMTIDEVDQAGAFIGWFQKYTDEAKAVFDGEQEASAGRRIKLSETAMVVRNPQDDRWVNQSHPVGGKLMVRAVSRCPDQKANACRPYEVTGNN